MTVIQRAQAPTPKFFKKVRTGGLLLGTIGAILLANSNSIPPALQKIAGYLTVAGGVASAVSQVTTNTSGSEDGSTDKGAGNGD